MIKYFYAVYDSKAKCFANPFFMVNDATAVRALAAAANDPSTEVCRFPEDFTLFLLGSFDDSTGVVTPLPQAKSLGMAANWKDAPIPKVGADAVRKVFDQAMQKVPGQPV